MELTKEYIQQLIDHYTAVSAAHKELSEERSEKREHHTALMMFYHGKSDAYIDLYNSLYPEMEGERASPLDEAKCNKTKEDIKIIYK